MKLTILNLGWLECDKNLMVACSVIATRDNRNVKAKYERFPVWAALIEHPSAGKILFDLGCHPEGMNGHWPDSVVLSMQHYADKGQNMVEQLKLCGTRPEEISKIIISHAHFDHYGNIGLFPHADIYITRQEFSDALFSVYHSNDPNAHGGYIREEIISPVKNYFFIEDGPLFDGIEVISLPGHTDGLIGLLVHLERETFLLPSDCVYTMENYGPPARPSGMVHNSMAYFRSIELVRKLAQRYHARLLLSHDMAQFETYKKAPEFYM